MIIVGTGVCARGGRRSGITLTEILIAILILGVGLVSLATLFPIGLLRLRDASRYSRSAILSQSAAADTLARGLLNSQSFLTADLLNTGLRPYWYVTATSRYNPLIQDTPSYGGDWPGGAYAGLGGGDGLGIVGLPTQVTVNGYASLPGPGLPFAYDPLWRFHTINTSDQFANGLPNQPGGYYLHDNQAFEARFGSGIGFIRPDPSDGGLPSAHGLQRLTNFNRPYWNGQPIMPSSIFVPSIFVSQEDLVWQDPNVTNFYTIDGISPANGGIPVSSPSAVVPDLNTGGGSPSLDWRYSWMVTGQLTNAGSEAAFDVNLVILENRPFGITAVTGPYGATHQVDGETVVEAVYGYSTHVLIPNGYPGGYGTAADRTVLLRWDARLPDPVVRPGDWIADVTYERQQAVVDSRWWLGNTNAAGKPYPLGVPNPFNNLEWDNLPAQRCVWYQIQKVTPPVPDPNVANHRSMVVYVNQSLQHRTLLDSNGNPVVLNAALISPYVVNVIPQTIFVR